MTPRIAEMIEAVQRPGWRWDIWARVLRNDSLDIIICPELLDALKVQDARELQVVLLGYESKSSLGMHAGFLQGEAAEEGCSRLAMRLTRAEADSLLSMVENGSFPMRPAAVSASNKVRQALRLAGIDPDAELEVDCTEDEAEFIARARLS